MENPKRQIKLCEAAILRKSISIDPNQKTYMNNCRSDKVFGRYNELVLLVLGFFLTTVLGTVLMNNYQEHTRIETERTTRFQAELSRATAVFEEVSRMLDRRLYRTRVVVWALKDNKSEANIKVAREEYKKAIADWNENLNRIFSLIEYSFGAEQRTTLESVLAEHLRSIHIDIDTCLTDRKSCDPKKIDDKINDFNPQIYAFDAKILSFLKDGSVGAFQRH